MVVKRNARGGIDYFCGDIHGCYNQLDLALKMKNFDPLKDRLFLLGDLVDRGPESHRVIEFMSKKWVIALQGNHDCSTYYLAKKVISHFPDHDKDTLISINNGGEWVNSQSRATLESFMDAVTYLPMAIEYQDHDGTPLLGLIHGEVPMNSSWSALEKVFQKLPCDYVASLVLHNEDIIYQTLYGRTKIRDANASGNYHSDKYRTKGIPILVCGHSIVPANHNKPFKVSNNRYIDHGLYKREGPAILYTLEDLL